MELSSATKGVRRSRKAFRRAVSALEHATTEKARTRHARRAANARRAVMEAERHFCEIALTDPA